MSTLRLRSIVGRAAERPNSRPPLISSSWPGMELRIQIVPHREARVKVQDPTKTPVQHFPSTCYGPGISFIAAQGPSLSLIDEQPEAMWSGGCGARTQSQEATLQERTPNLAWPPLSLGTAPQGPGIGNPRAQGHPVRPFSAWLMLLISTERR